MKKILLVFLLLITIQTISAQNHCIVLISTNVGNMKVKLYNDTPKHRDAFIQLAEEGHFDGTLFYRVLKDYIIQGGSKDSRNAPPGKEIGYGDPKMTVDDEIRPNHFHKKGALCAPRQPDAINPFKQSDVSQFFIVDGIVFRPGQLDTMEMAVNNPIKKEIKNKYMTLEIRKKLKELKKANKVKEFRELATPIKERIETEYELHPGKLIFTDEQRRAYTTIGGAPQLDGQYTIFGEVIKGFDVIETIAQLKTDKNDRPYRDVIIRVTVLE